MPGSRSWACPPSRSSVRGRPLRPSSTLQRRSYSSYLPSVASSVLIWVGGWRLSGQKRTGSGMGAGLWAGVGEDDRKCDAGLQNEIWGLLAQGQLLPSQSRGIFGALSARSSLLPKALPISCRCIADILPINYRLRRGGTDSLSPAIRLPPKSYHPCYLIPTAQGFGHLLPSILSALLGPKPDGLKDRNFGEVKKTDRESRPQSSMWIGLATSS